MSHFYTPSERQKTYGFLTFSGGIESDIGLKWVNILQEIIKILYKKLLKAITIEVS